MAAMIQIRTTYASIGIESQYATLRVAENRQNERLNMRQTMPQLRINTTPPELTIDQTQTFASEGSKTPLLLMRSFYQTSTQKGIDAIGTIAKEASRFLAIENPRDPVPELARQKGVKEKHFKMAAMPSVPPKITIKRGDLNIKAEPGKVDTNWDLQPPKLEYQPYSVKVFLQKEPQVEITVVEEGDSYELPDMPGTRAE